MCPTHILVHRTPPLGGGSSLCLVRGIQCFQGVNIPPTGWLHKPLCCSAILLCPLKCSGVDRNYRHCEFECLFRLRHTSNIGVSPIPSPASPNAVTKFAKAWPHAIVDTVIVVYCIIYIRYSTCRMFIIINRRVRLSCLSVKWECYVRMWIACELADSGVNPSPWRQLLRIQPPT